MGKANSQAVKICVVLQVFFLFFAEKILDNTLLMIHREEKKVLSGE